MDIRKCWFFFIIFFLTFSFKGHGQTESIISITTEFKYSFVNGRWVEQRTPATIEVTSSPDEVVIHEGVERNAFPIVGREKYKDDEEKTIYLFKIYYKDGYVLTLHTLYRNGEYKFSFIKGAGGSNVDRATKESVFYTTFQEDNPRSLFDFE